MKRSTGMPPMKLGSPSARQTPTLARLTQKGQRPRPSQPLSIPTIPKVARPKPTEAVSHAVQAAPAPESAALERIVVEESIDIDTSPIVRSEPAATHLDGAAPAMSSRAATDVDPAPARSRSLSPRSAHPPAAGSRRAAIAEPKPSATPVPRITARATLARPAAKVAPVAPPIPRVAPVAKVAPVASVAPAASVAPTANVAPVANVAPAPATPAPRPPAPITAKQVEEMEAAAFELDEADLIPEEEAAIGRPPAADPSAAAPPLPPVPPTPATAVRPAQATRVAEWVEPVEPGPPAVDPRLRTVNGEVNSHLPASIEAPAMFSSIASAKKPRALWPWLLVALLAGGGGAAVYVLYPSNPADAPVVESEATPAPAAAAETEAEPEIQTLPAEAAAAAEAQVGHDGAAASADDSESAGEEITEHAGEATAEGAAAEGDRSDGEDDGDVEPAALALPDADEDADEDADDDADDDKSRDEDRRERRARREARAEREASADSDGEDEEAHAEPGTLMLSAKPPCSIFIDGKDTGLTTPQRELPLDPGRHKVTLVNDELGIKETLRVRIKSGETKKVVKDLTDRLP